MNIVLCKRFHEHSICCDYKILAFGASASSAGPTLFSQSQAQQPAGGLFGATSAFGASKPLFGTATTAASNPFGGLSTANTGTSLFNQNQNKVCSSLVSSIYIQFPERWI